MAPHRRRVLPAAIAGAVVGGVVLLSVSLLFWLRRRRRQLYAPRLPRQFVVGGTQATEPLHRSNKAVERPAQPEPPRDIHRDAVVQPDAHVVQEDAAPLVDESLAQRKRRVEAQLDALLILGVPNGAPPEYTV
jgi:hypothetical protein